MRAGEVLIGDKKMMTMDLEAELSKDTTKRGDYMTKTTEGLHYKADGELGGVEREYKEVKRDAVVGDLVYLIHVGEYVQTSTVDFCCGEFEWGDHKTLEPTGVVRIEGERFCLVVRPADVGEQVIIVNPQYAGGHRGYEKGNVFKVTNVFSQSVNSDALTSDKSDFLRFWDDEYGVLEPFGDEPKSEDDDEILGVVANLARRVSELEARLEDVDPRMVKIDDKVERITDDFITIDVRTQPDQVAETLAKQIKKGGRRYGR